MYLFFPFSPFVCFACFCFVAVDFVFIHYWPIFFVCACFKVYLFFFTLCLFYVQFSRGVKISCFGVVYKFLSVDMELAVIKDLFIIFYI